MNKEHEIRQAIHLVWRNLPGQPSTFSACPTPDCDQLGRGGGKCLLCAEEALGRLTTYELANSYVEVIKALRRIEEEMFDVK
jgi:hypothetical protein